MQINSALFLSALRVNDLFLTDYWETICFKVHTYKVVIQIEKYGYTEMARDRRAISHQQFQEDEHTS